MDNQFNRSKFKSEIFTFFLLELFLLEQNIAILLKQSFLDGKVKSFLNNMENETKVLRLTGQVIENTYKYKLGN